MAQGKKGKPRTSKGKTIVKKVKRPSTQAPVPKLEPISVLPASKSTIPLASQLLVQDNFNRVLFSVHDLFKNTPDAGRDLLLKKPSLDDSDQWRHLVTQTKLGPQVGELETAIKQLKSEINQKAQALLEQSFDAKEKGKQIRALRRNIKALSEKQSLSHLLNRVGGDAREKLLSSPAFRALFDQDSPHYAFVLSIDIRRSTELMLKAREPKLYAEFIIALASQLRETILENYGIFDKFTGDGILAFFPDFYSGEDGGYFAIKAASDCHRIFAAHYEANKRCFISILKDIGLGIGVDYGQVQIVQIGGDFTVVGTPVVYACRMGGAEARHTYINQPAFEQLFEKYSAVFDFESREIEIKHEGATLAYNVELNGKPYSPALPEWGTPVDSSDSPTDGE